MLQCCGILTETNHLWEDTMRFEILCNENVSNLNLQWCHFFNLSKYHLKLFSRIFFSYLVIWHLHINCLVGKQLQQIFINIFAGRPLDSLHYYEFQLWNITCFIVTMNKFTSLIFPPKLSLSFSRPPSAWWQTKQPCAGFPCFDEADHLPYEHEPNISTTTSLLASMAKCWPGTVPV